MVEFMETFRTLLKNTEHNPSLNKFVGIMNMFQAIAGLRDLHNFGYLHRDIKPANMCFGLTEKVVQK